jgi:hypothetical protein
MGMGDIDEINEAVMKGSPGKFLMVDEDQYQSSRNFLFGVIAGEGGVFGSSTAFLFARRLLLTFLTGTAPPEATSQPDTIGPTRGDSCLDGSGTCLDHNVGVRFGRSDNIKHYDFPAKSAFAETIRQSTLMKGYLTLGKQLCEDKPIGDNCFHFGVFGTIGFQDVVDPGLYRTLGTASADIDFTFHKLSSGKIFAVIKGSLSDLYDFDLNLGTLSHRAALVQAGFDTLGVAGGVFTHTVHLDANIPDLDAFLSGS